MQESHVDTPKVRKVRKRLSETRYETKEEGWVIIKLQAPHQMGIRMKTLRLQRFGLWPQIIQKQLLLNSLLLLLEVE